MEKQAPSMTIEKLETLPINSSSSNLPKLAWWIEIYTVTPVCTYYFSPFDKLTEAELSLSGYIEDLIEEEAKDIVVLIKKCQPDILTIEQDVRA